MSNQNNTVSKVITLSTIIDSQIKNFKLNLLTISLFVGLGLLYSIFLHQKNYYAFVEFTSPTEYASFKLPDEGVIPKDLLSPNKLLSTFLRTISQKSFQKKVFIEGGYTKYFSENDSNSRDDYIDNFLDGIKLSNPNKDRDDLVFNFLINEPYSISIKSNQSIFLLEFLNDLVLTANLESKNMLLTEIEIIKKNSLEGLKLRKNLLQREINIKKKVQLESLNNSLALAKAENIFENNFSKLVNFNEISTPFSINYSIPDWFLKGEKILKKEIEFAKKSQKYELDIFQIDKKITTVNEINIDFKDFDTITFLNKSSKPENISRSRKIFPILGLVFGVLFSIILNAAMNRTDN